MIIDLTFTEIVVKSFSRFQNSKIVSVTFCGLGLTLSRSSMTIKRALRELEDGGLIRRDRQGAGKPNRIYVLIPEERP